MPPNDRRVERLLRSRSPRRDRSAILHHISRRTKGVRVFRGGPTVATMSAFVTGAIGEHGSIARVERRKGSRS
jgi:hypothetical protein